MTKHLIVVVHGVGVKQAGTSSDMLAAALKRDAYVPVSSDDFNIPEAQIYDEGTKQILFPCRVRTYERQTGTRSRGNERVIADFYWGDVTNIGAGNTGLVMGLIKTILGISHIIRENASDLFADAPFARKMSNAFVKILHGPIAALAVIILGGLLLSWAAGFLQDKPSDAEAYRNLWAYESWAAIMLGVIATGIGGLFLKRRTSYLEALLWSWLVIWGCVLTLFAALDYLPQVSGFLFGWLDGHLKNQICLGDSTCAATMTGIFIHGARLVALMLLLFILELVIITGLHLYLLGRSWFGTGSNGVPVLAPHAAAGMLIFWFILIAFALVLLDGLGNFLPHANYLQSTLFLLAAAVFFLVVLIAITVAIFVSKNRWASSVDPASYFRTELDNAEKHRLIVHRWLKVALFFGFVVFALYTLVYLGTENKDWFIAMTAAALAIAAVIAAGVAYYTDYLRAGLGIASDVITYLNNYSWEGGNSTALPKQTIVERFLGWYPDVGAKRYYYLRRRIQERLRVLIWTMLREQKPDHLSIVSHSQGTIIATDVVETDGHLWRSFLGNQGKLRLVTMGSPFTHIHNHYFPGSFVNLAERKALHKRAKGSAGVLDDWHNIFRIDDFVGTHIDPEAKWPVEHPVPRNGHTNYWRDRNVIAVLEKVLN